ncbi:MAG: hypothetical protein DWQ04_23510, partial [Chloroflexi bacterium]
MASISPSTKSKYVIQRHARAREPLPTDTVKIGRPPQLPPAPMKPNILTMLPTIVMALSTGAISFFINSGSSMGSRSLLTVVPMLLMGVMMMSIQMWVHRSNVKKHKAQVVELQAAYQRELQGVRDRLESLAQKQQRILYQENPPIVQLLNRVQRRDKSLWERQPNDNDFLNLRLGIGRLPLSATVRVPEQEGENPSFLPAQQLAAEFETVGQLPITTNLNWLGSVGIRSQRPSEALYLAFTMVANIVSHHSPDEVCLYLISHRHDAAERWGWLRWLPHTNALRGGQDGIVRLSFSPGHTDEEVLLEVSQLLRARDDDRKRSRRLERHMVVIFDETPSLQGHGIMGLLLGHDPNKEKENLLNASAIFVQNPVPPQVNAMIELQGSTLSYRETWVKDANQVSHQGTAELSTPKQVESLARSMAPLRTEASYNAAGGILPSSVRLVELVGATQPNEVNLGQLYSKIYDPKKVMAFPVGLNVDLKPQTVILREAGQGGHGSHAMLAGMTGTGKSVMLQAIVLSLASTNSPAHLNFVLADFKGGASELAKLQGLPHLAGFVTDLNLAMVERFRISLESEVRRRKELFDTAKENLGQPVANIRTYNKLRPDHPLPHLVVLLDEFAFGLNINPNFRGTIDTIAAQGRALGIHLILSTQRAADFDNKIRPNIDIRMSLRVASREDSKTMFNRDEAYSRLQRPGQAYVQVGDNEVFEMFQAARADVPYQPDGTANLNLVEDFSIYQVLPDGRRDNEPIYEHNPAAESEVVKEPEVEMVSEAEVLVQHIKEYCTVGDYPPVRQIALPPLPPAGELDLLSLLTNESVYSRWHGNGWSKETRSGTYRLRLPLGMLDLPAQQAQHPYLVDFKQGDGNLMVVGPTGSGKSLFLRSLIFGLAFTHTPAELNFYILSRGPALAFFEALPHCQGNVIRPTEDERQSRLFTSLEAEINRRRSLMRDADVDSVMVLRQERPDLVLPAIFVVIEDYASFRANHEMTQPERLEQIKMLAREGNAVDLHVILSSNDARSVLKLRDNVGQRLALGLKTVGDYMEILEKRAEVLPEIAGRGYVVQNQLPLECQIAAPTPESPRSLQEMIWLKEMIEAMNAHWSGYRPKPVVEMPSFVELTWLWETAVQNGDPSLFLSKLQETWGRTGSSVSRNDLPVWQGGVPVPDADNLFRVLTAPVGIVYETQRPYSFELMEWGTHNLIVGPGKSGKSDLLLTFCLAATSALSPEELNVIVLDSRQPFRLHPLSHLPHVRYANSTKLAKQHLTALLDDLEKQADEGAAPPQNQTSTGFLLSSNSKQTVLLIDDLLLWMQKGDGELFKLVDDCMRKGQDAGLKVVLADTSQNINQSRQITSSQIMVTQPNGTQMTQMYQIRFVQTAVQYARGIALSAESSDVTPLQPQTRLQRNMAQMKKLRLGNG